MNRADRHREWFIKHRPWLAHVSLASDMASIHAHGLLSTSALLDLFEVPETERQNFEYEPRKRPVTLTHPVHGSACLNDQSPLHAGGLSRCLEGMTSREWCKELNSRVHIRPIKSRSQSAWSTKLSTGRHAIVLVADTRAFLSIYEEQISAAAINPGYTLREPIRRGRYTFRPLRELFEEPSFTVSAASELSLLHRIERTELFERFQPEVLQA